MDQPLLTELEAARELRVSKQTIRRERDAGRLDFVRIRSRIFIPLDAIRAYVERQTCRNMNSPSGQGSQTGTSSGRTVDEASAVRQARRIAGRLS